MARQQQVTASAQQSGGVALVTTTETTAVSLSSVSTSGPDDQVVLEGCLVVAPGTATTALTVRIRRVTPGGTVVIGARVDTDAAAGQPNTLNIQATDTPGEVAGATYQLTVVQNNATGNGTCSFANLSATY